MKKVKKFILCNLLVLALAGCTAVPGSHLSTKGKRVVTMRDGSVNINKLVDVYPVSPQLLESLQPKLTYAQPNTVLDKSLKNYQYRVGIGDVLNIIVWEHPELTIPAGSYRSAADSGTWVQTDGSIYYPYVGKVNVSGKTVVEIRQILTNRLSKYIHDPQIDVNVASFRAKKAYITGEVKQSGKQPITNVPLTILDAINIAGGLTDDADWNNVILTQKGKKRQISLQSLLQHGDLTHNELLQDGDILFIPRNDNLKVFVMGDVNMPSTLKIDRAGMTLTEALSSTGDMNKYSANAKGIFVIRAVPKTELEMNIDEQSSAPKLLAKMTKSDAPASDKTDTNNEQKIAKIYQFDMSDASSLVMGTEFLLQPYDIVYVTSTSVSRWNRLILNLLPTIQGVHDMTETLRFIKNW